MLIALNYVEYVASNQTISMPSLNKDYSLKGILIGNFNSKTSEEFLDGKRCQIIHVVNDLLVVLKVQLCDADVENLLPVELRISRVMHIDLLFEFLFEFL